MAIDLSKSCALRREKVSVPEWTEEDVYVQEMTGRQLATLNKYSRVVDGQLVTEHEVAITLVLALVYENGNPLFTEADIEALEDQPIGRIANLFTVASRVCGFEIPTAEAINSLKNARKKSSTANSRRNYTKAMKKS